MRFERVDDNQKEIVTALRSCGAIVKHVYSVKNLFDILVYYNGITYNVEKKCKEDIEKVGVKYWVIYSVKDALKMIGI